MQYCQLICVVSCPLRNKALLNDKPELWRTFRDLYFSLWCDYTAWLLCLIRFRLYITLISLILQLNTHRKSNRIYVLFDKYLQHFSAITAPSSGGTRITSQNHLLIVRSLQWLNCRAWIISYITISRWFWEVIRILCFVDRASLYNLANKSNQVHNSV